METNIPDKQAEDKARLNNNLTKAVDELRSMPEYAAIDRIIQGYCNEWSEFDGSLETKMAFQKRIYILVMRLLPKLTHRQIFLGLVEDYKRILHENEELLKDVAERKALELKDISLFDTWFKRGNYDQTIPMLADYRAHMKRLNITDNGDIAEMSEKEKGAP